MERTILHVAIDSFPIQAERFRCPKLIGRPVALTPGGSPRPRVVAVSREARGAGIAPGTPLIVARRLCRDLVALPLDRDLYAGIGEAIFDRLSPFAPVVEAGGNLAAGGDRGVGGDLGQGSGAAASGRFFLDLTGIARRHSDARDRAARAGREIESAFGLHPTLGVAANKLVSRVAAGVVAPDGDLLDVSSGSEPAFLAPLPVRVLPAARPAEVASRLDLLNVRFVGELQALLVPQLTRVFGGAGLLLWRQALGIDSTPVCPPDVRPRVVAEETLAGETNDGRALTAHVERLAAEVGAGLRVRGEAARSLALSAAYADGRDALARRTFASPLCGAAELRLAAADLLSRTVKRRVRVRRLRLTAWGIEPRGMQLDLWDAPRSEAWSATAGPTARALALESALDRVCGRFGAGALLPASWILHGLAVRPSPRS